MGKAVSLKGTRETWRLILDDTASIAEIEADLTELLEGLKKEKTSAEETDYLLQVETGARLLPKTVATRLERTIERESHFKVTRFMSDVLFKEEAEEYARQTGMELIVRNVRNGQIVESEKDLLVIGKIFPGGLVRSAGHVFILGELGGTVQAGSQGNEEAVVISNFSKDAQVRIADHVKVIEPAEEQTVFDYRALVVNDMYVMEEIDPKKLLDYRPDIGQETGGLEAWLEQL